MQPTSRVQGPIQGGETLACRIALNHRVVFDQNIDSCPYLETHGTSVTTWTPKARKITAQGLNKRPKGPVFYILLGAHNWADDATCKLGNLPVVWRPQVGL